MRERFLHHAALACIQRAALRRVNRLMVILVALGLAGCAGDRSILDPAGQAARDVVLIWWVMLTFATVVFIAVISLWLYTFKRKYHERTPQQERKIARRWVIGGGILLPVFSVSALLMFGVPAGKRMLPLPLGHPVEVIEVIGHQWWWEVRYPGAEGGEVVTSNQLVLPAGEPVDFHVTSADVIHAFWIPRLGGKIDMLPGRVNVIRLEADEPGVYGAQCAEFCGAQHTHMDLHVEALEREAFEAWLEDRQAERLAELALANDEFAQARDTFSSSCAVCHSVAGISSSAIGPDLSDIGARHTLGAGVLPMEEGAIQYWLENHQTLKPSNKMPSHDYMETATLESLGAWLESLTP
ncbi:cytochrome c oxidase subunit 2 [Vreelandella songnenensis]|uniref:Cytochrome aa3 subunit 2 n=1 Tax=Vreelandella songnenensis TaxID=1176243 RepID=A0A2T0UUN8_9GAMM|nr:cytochrome c oxidase subunit II [Halomonas songnenensis]PRY61630.1 cytochrome c oxidase subunit 2 [Halomonas songnenensis]